MEVTKRASSAREVFPETGISHPGCVPGPRLPAPARATAGAEATADLVDADAQPYGDALSPTWCYRRPPPPGGEEIMSGHAITSPEARLIPAMGNVQHNTSWTVKGLTPTVTYWWSVQAVDTGFMGGPWAAEQSVTVP